MHRKKYVHFNTLEPIKPLLRAYTLGYLTVTTPRLFAFLRTVRRSHLQSREILSTLQKILITSTQINRFPTAAAVIVGGATALPHLIQACIDYVLSSQRRGTTRLSNRLAALIRFLCTFWSAWLAFSLLNRDESWARKRAISQSNTTISTGAPRTSALHQPPPPPYHPRYAGKTIDFTAFAFCRALDVAVIALWTRTRSRSWHPEQRNPRLANFTRKIVDPSVFAGSAAIIMWSWFYSPERLPRSYNHWISKAADIDPRLIQALRLARQGNFVYGEDTGQATLLTGLCQELNLPDEFADPSKTIPIPCELYHCGTGKSCEIHALSRFWRGWKFAMGIYLPLQILTILRSPKPESVLKALRAAVRSSSFLAGFVASFYYAVCLARTRLGPKVFSYKTVTPQMWDSGLCVLAGCLACGWSVLLEKPSRRQEVAFFVAPRALATVLPRVYDRQYRHREQAIFATSIATVLTALTSGDQRNVRGVLGRILARVVKG
ncbi:integral membrane protein [Fonsecaea pedrosoi]|nr:integral membrane protein [Fonsecaea pedrosoi]